MEQGKQSVERPELPCADAGTHIPRSPDAARPSGAGFLHGQPVAVRRLFVGVLADGQRVIYDDWSERGSIRATKRDLNGYCGRWTVRLAGGVTADIHADHLRPLR